MEATEKKKYPISSSHERKHTVYLSLKNEDGLKEIIEMTGAGESELLNEAVKLLIASYRSK